MLSKTVLPNGTREDTTLRGGRAPAFGIARRPGEPAESPKLSETISLVSKPAFHFFPDSFRNHVYSYRSAMTGSTRIARRAGK